ncbi:MAG: helix-turn-helix domain-containing protein [Clostridiales bacterium]|nr:helix-turn-helix domain-containing protein [Clostridiales bacterium]
MKNQREQIIDYIKEYGSITNIEAMSQLNICDARKRISEAINDYGVAIVKTPETSKNRYGKKCHYIRYSLAKESEAIGAS